MLHTKPGRVAQSVGHLTRKSGVLGSIPGLATYFRFSFRFFQEGQFSVAKVFVHEVLVNRLGGLSLPRKSVVRFTDRSDMTLDVYRGRKTTMQQQQQCYIPSFIAIVSLVLIRRFFQGFVPYKGVSAILNKFLLLRSHKLPYRIWLRMTKQI